MTEKMEELELALQQINDAKRMLFRNTAEAKSRIQCNISRQLETLRTREVWLLNQLDVISSAKEEVLQQQSARLNKALGVIQSSLQFPDLCARLDLGELNPEETPNISFKCDQASLRDAIMSYGRIDPTSALLLHSPFMGPEQAAPSLPKHFEDYNDAEHHVLYKTLEEVNRCKTNEPVVCVNIPKLSNHLEDWLQRPPTIASPTIASLTVTSPVSNSTLNIEPVFTFSKLSDSLSFWLKDPTSTVASTPKAVGLDQVRQWSLESIEDMTNDWRQPGSLEAIDGMATDASIRTWLHKIKQNTYEEEDDDYDFVEEMSDIRANCSVDSMDNAARNGDTVNKCLNSTCLLNADLNASSAFVFQNNSLPLEDWLLKSNMPVRDVDGSLTMDMSRYLNKITDELSQWLVHKANSSMQNEPDLSDNKEERLKHIVPSTLNLSWCPGKRVEKLENPWLLRSQSASSLSSTCCLQPIKSSSFTVSSKSCDYNKWLLHGGCNNVPSTTGVPLSIMEKYKLATKNMSWIQSGNQDQCTKNHNPLANFGKGLESSVWLKQQKAATKIDESPSPLNSIIKYHKSSPQAMWLHNKEDNGMSPLTQPPGFGPLLGKGDNSGCISR